MEYTSQIDSEARVVNLVGKFQFSDHNMFDEAVLQALDDPAIKKVEIDLAKVDYVDSAALGLLLLANERAAANSKSLVLKNPEGQVRRMFEISSFFESFDVKE